MHAQRSHVFMPFLVVAGLTIAACATRPRATSPELAARPVVECVGRATLTVWNNSSQTGTLYARSGPALAQVTSVMEVAAGGVQVLSEPPRADARYELKAGRGSKATVLGIEGYPNFSYGLVRIERGCVRS